MAAIGFVGSIENRFKGMGKFYEGVLTPEEEQNGIGLVLFKPDAVQPSSLYLPIQQFILAELARLSGKAVAFFGFSQLIVGYDVLAKLYPEQRHQEYLEYMHDHFQTGPALVMLVAAKDAPQALNRLKGSVRTGEGVRGKFGAGKPIDDQTLEAWKQKKLDPAEAKRVSTELIAANLIHVPDSKEETQRAMKLLIPEHDLDHMRESIPFVRRWYGS